MSYLYTVEELMISDSFINYCFRTNQEDISFWEQYLIDNPDEREKTEEASTLVLALRVMLNNQELGRKRPTGLLQSISHGNPGKTLRPERRNNHKRMRLLIIAVAAVFLTVLVSSAFFYTKPKQTVVAEPLSAAPVKKQTLFTARLGEKKLIVLPDSTKVYLNAGSVLTLADDFGKENRIVNLKGEAMFEVTHNRALPFLVHTDRYYVRVLGTVFNVKAYPGDKTSETSLVSGKVEIFMQKDSADYLYKVLKPSQKFVMNMSAGPGTKTGEPAIRTAITALSYSNDENVETAWIHNRLIIENEKFSDIKERIERRYDVTLEFDDEEVKQYSFTATFESENIEQVMNALKASYFFTYKIDGKTIKIGKRNPDSNN